MSIFKRPVPGTDTDPAKPTAHGTPPQTPKPPSLPAPLPELEVVEGNLDSDWALWEDSVAFLDSQLQSDFGALKPPEVRESPKAKPADDPDPFAFEKVRRRTP